MTSVVVPPEEVCSHPWDVWIGYLAVPTEMQYNDILTIPWQILSELMGHQRTLVF